MFAFSTGEVTLMLSSIVRARPAITISAISALACISAHSARGADLTRRPFGAMPDGTPVEAITLSGGRTAVTVITLGASIQAVRIPDSAGRTADVVLGYDDLLGYITKSNYFGATVGRVANRIAGGRYVIDGQQYHAPINDGPNSLHGGKQGFDKAVWQVFSVERGRRAAVTMRLVSPDGDQGYPGKLTVDATYEVDDAGRLSITYRATTDRATIVNISNHSYWNLAGEGAARGALGEMLTVPAAEYTPVDATLVPTGAFAPVAGTPFEFRSPQSIVTRVRDGADAQLRAGRGYDHNWVVSRSSSAEPRLVARLSDTVSGRSMDILSNQPGLQFYSGNFLDGTTVGKAGHLYRQGDGICLEPQMFPDTPNRPSFGTITLYPGQVYRNRIIYHFSINHPR